MKKIRKKKKKKLFNIFFFVILLVFILFFIRKIYVKDDIVELKNENIPITTENQAIILRHEVLVNSINNGILESKVEQLQRVKNGQIIAELEISNESSLKNSDVSSEEVYFVDEENLISQKDQIYNELIACLKNEDFINSFKIKEDLNNKLYRIKKIQDSKSVNAYNIKNEDIRNVGSENASIGQKVSLYAVKSGVISFLTDGFEKALSYPNRYNINYDLFWDKVIENKDTRNQNISKGDLVYKIINTNDWYLACKIPKKDIGIYKPYSKVFIEYDNSKYQAVVEETFDSKNSAILMLRVSTQIPFFLNERLCNVKLIHDEVRGIFIPNECIVKKDNQIGVYYLDVDNKLRFIPIFIIKELEKGYIVYDSKYREENYNGDINIIDTVRSGYKIIKNAQKYKENDIINVKNGG